MAVKPKQLQDAGGGIACADVFKDLSMSSSHVSFILEFETLWKKIRHFWDCGLHSGLQVTVTLDFFAFVQTNRAAIYTLKEYAKMR